MEAILIKSRYESVKVNNDRVSGDFPTNEYEF